MTSLFSRLQKLNKEAAPPEWGFEDEESATTLIAKKPDSYMYLADSDGNMDMQNARLVVECRNSLPAVLNLIEAAEEMVSWDYVGDADQDVYKRLERAVAVFVSGQEEPK